MGESGHGVCRVYSPKGVFNSNSNRVYCSKKQKLRIQGFRGTLFSDKHIFLLINDFFLLNPIVAEYNCFVLNIHFLSSWNLHVWPMCVAKCSFKLVESHILEVKRPNLLMWSIAIPHVTVFQNMCLRKNNLMFTG